MAGPANQFQRILLPFAAAAAVGAIVVLLMGPPRSLRMDGADQAGEPGAGDQSAASQHVA